MPQPEADYSIDIDPSEWDDEPLPKLVPPVPSNTDREMAVVQARAAQADGAKVAEGTVIDSGKVELLGKQFRVAEKIGLMPLLKFASASDMSTEDPRAMSAVYSMLKDCIYEGRPGCGECEKCAPADGSDGDEKACKSYDKGDWAAFENHAIDTKADADELLTVITQVLEIVSGRPTTPPSGSSAGRRTTRRVSTGNTSAARGRASRR
jgi:hypothetical protein